MNYRVLLVDDEPSAIQMLKSLVDWEALGFTLVGCARNGRDGLKSYQELHPDIVITDIQMPVMDGLDMIRHIRTVDQNAMIVILSCHENFYYARQSIQLGVNDYLIKDLLTQEELTWQLNNISAALHKNREQAAPPAEPVVKLPEQAMRFHQARTLWESVLNRLITPAVLLETLSGIWKRSEYTPVAFMEVLLEQTDGGTPDYYQAIGAVNLALDDLWGGDVYDQSDGQLSVAFQLESITSQLKLFNDCNLICQRVRTALAGKQWIVTIGLSHPFLNFEEIWKYREQAAEALRQRIFHGKGKNIFYHYISGSSGSRGDQSIKSCIDAITKAIEAGNLATVSQTVTQLYSPLVNGYMKYNYIKEVNSRMFGLLMELLVRQGSSYEDFFGCSHIPFETVESLDTVEEMAEWFCTRLSSIITSAHQETVVLYSKRVSDAVAYIKAHYTEGLSLEVVSDHLKIHKGYLCRIFKQEVGLNITDYIIALWIEQAKKLMTTGDRKLYQVAEAAGFASAQQFNLYFKRLEGETPAQWLKSEI